MAYGALGKFLLHSYSRSQSEQTVEDLLLLFILPIFTIRAIEFEMRGISW